MEYDMAWAIVVILVGVIAYLLQENFVKDFKIGYYEMKLKVNGIQDTVKDIKTIIDIE